MIDIKKTDPLDQQRQTHIARTNIKNKDNRQQKHKFINIRRQVFLTDTQTDQTKSSSQTNTAEIELLQYSVRKLEKENAELKECILKMKASQFYGINQEKVKNLIKQNQSLLNEVKLLRKQLERVLIEKDFLQRNNKALRQRYEESTKQNNKGFINSRLKTQFNRINQYQFIDGVDDFMKEGKQSVKQNRSKSSQKGNIVKKKSTGLISESKTKAEDKKKEGIKHQEYYQILKYAKSNRKL